MRRYLIGSIVSLLMIFVQVALSKQHIPITESIVDCQSDRWGRLCPNGCVLRRKMAAVQARAHQDTEDLRELIRSWTAEQQSEIRSLEAADRNGHRHMNRVLQTLSELDNVTRVLTLRQEADKRSLLKRTSAIAAVEETVRNTKAQTQQLHDRVSAAASGCEGGFQRKRGIPRCTLPVLSGRDCAAIYRAGARRSGVYVAKPEGMAAPVRVLCDMEDDGGGWTVIQRRFDGTLSFESSWKAYRDGFGQWGCDKVGEMWAGNELIHRLTQQEDQHLKIELHSARNQTRSVLYRDFRVGGKRDFYRLESIGDFVADPRGDIGDPFGARGSRGSADHGRFATRDKVDDCGDRRRSGGWWHTTCEGGANLNGRWNSERRKGNSHRDGIAWPTWNRGRVRIKGTRMKIRPNNYS